MLSCCCYKSVCVCVSILFICLYGILFVYYLIPTRSRWYYEVEVKVLLEQTDTVVFVSCILACFLLLVGGGVDVLVDDV